MAKSSVVDNGMPLETQRDTIDPEHVNVFIVPDARSIRPAVRQDLNQPSPIYYRLLTRSFDILIAGFILVVALPILAVASFLVWRSSPGPVIYRQVRVGRLGTPFVLYKFRTMVAGADSMLARDESRQSAFQERWKLQNDPRITSVGKWLRKTSIDELPQLLNVLKGEMSIVGPRPVRPDELIECYGDFAPLVFSVKPGLTGLWQVTGRSDVNYDARIALDLEYLQRRSFWFDCVLLLRTIPAVLLMRGAM
jgi:lipopolysaccharide/colanic/teichoic acid biosynthesis glycosyltransferase